MTRNEWKAIYLLRKVVACKPSEAIGLLTSSQISIKYMRKENRKYKLLSRGKEAFEAKYEAPIRSIIQNKVISSWRISIEFGTPKWECDYRPKSYGPKRTARGTITVSRAWKKQVYDNNMVKVGDYFVLTATPINANVDMDVYRVKVADLLERETIEGYVAQITFRDMVYNHFSEQFTTAIRKADLKKKNLTKKIMFQN
jgi:hypothetical protein